MPAESPRDGTAGRERLLAPCAVRAADGGERAHPEGAHPYRGRFQRDRERIVHCSAFRRLDYKTQVFVPHERDHFRTRLTHTLEVAQVGRALARAVGANEDVVEAAALAHDLGHAPFGHAGETALDGCMTGRGGFEHNRQSLRVVEYLEHPYPSFRGLNLTSAVRECLASHRGPYDAPALPAGGAGYAPLEGQLVDLADELAYTSADLYDALAAGWIAPDDLADLALWRAAGERAAEQFPDAGAAHRRIQTCRNVLALTADDVAAETARRLAAMRPGSPEDVRRAPRRCAAFSDALAPSVREMQAFLLRRVYEHPQALAEDAEAERIVGGLFAAYVASPELLPERYRRRIDEQGAHRVACDYIAGMTDRFCRQAYRDAVGGGRPPAP